MITALSRCHLTYSTTSFWEYCVLAAEAKVKVYFNSEFGSDYDPETWGSAVYEPKKAHRAAAEKLGLKTVAIATGAFSSFVRTPFFGALTATRYPFLF